MWKCFINLSCLGNVKAEVVGEVGGKWGQQGEERVGVKQGAEEPRGELGAEASESRSSTDGTPGLKWVVGHVLPVS